MDSETDEALRLVDIQLAAALAALPDFTPLSSETLAGFRAGAADDAIPLISDALLSVTEIVIPADPDVPAILYQPPGACRTRAALLHVHGGGYVVGSARRDDAAMRRLALALDVTILSVDYRLAPETPYPGALDDCRVALRYLHDQAAMLGLDTDRIAVRGVSAGGGLAAALALDVMQRGDLPICHLSLLYPMLDDRTPRQAFAGLHVWTIEANRFGWAAYLGQLTEPPPTTAAVGRAADLTGFPPTFIAVGAIDLFADENIAFARRLIRDGVPTELHVYPGAYHGFVLVSDASVAKAADDATLSALRRALHFSPEGHRS